MPAAERRSTHPVRARGAGSPSPDGSGSRPASPCRAGVRARDAATPIASWKRSGSCSADLLPSRAQGHRDRVGKAIPARDFVAQPRAAAGRELVELRLAVVFRSPPFTVEEALLLQPVERGIERALL